MTVKLRPPRRRRPHLLVEGVRYVVPLTWFHTMIALRHIELRGKRQDEARLCAGRELRINAEGTVQIIDTATEVGFPVPISPIYKMGDRRDFGENHIDLSLAQPTREFVVEKTGLVNDARVLGVRFERKFAEVPA